MKVGDSIKKRIEELNSLSEEENKAWADKQQDEAFQLAVRTKWAYDDPNECEENGDNTYKKRYW